MKTILSHIFCLALPFIALGDTSAPKVQQIYVAADGTVRGPFTHSPAPLSGETVVTLTDAQFAQLTTIRTANPQVTKWKWDGSQFSVHPLETLRLQLLSLYNGLTPGEQQLFLPQFSGVKTMLDEGNVTEARLIIFLSGSGMPTDIANARQSMLNAIDALFPPAQ